MNTNRDKKPFKLTEKTLTVLNEAFIKAKKNYVEKFPESGFAIDWTGKNTEEEKVIEIFEAFLRTGLSPEEALEKTPEEYFCFKEMEDAFQTA